MADNKENKEELPQDTNPERKRIYDEINAIYDSVRKYSELSQERYRHGRSYQLSHFFYNLSIKPCYTLPNIFLLPKKRLLTSRKCRC